MLHKYILILFFLLSCSHSKMANEFPSTQILIRCHLFNMEGELIRQLPGRACHLDDDGSFVGIFNNNKMFVKFGPTLDRVWRHFDHAHHQINTNSSNHYLVMTSDFQMYKGVQTRFDTFLILDQIKGRILGRFRVAENVDVIPAATNALTGELYPFDWDEIHKDMAKVEYTHFNSFYEIPAPVSGMPEIEKGDYIVGGAKGSPILFLNKDLTKLKATLLIPEVATLHDVQALNNGNLLLYINDFKKDSSYFGTSMIAEYNPKEKKLIKVFNDFHISTTGGVQKLENGNYFFSYHDKKGAYAMIVSPNGEVIKKINFSYFRNSPHIQQAKLRDFTKHLQVNTGP